MIRLLLYLKQQKVPSHLLANMKTVIKSRTVDQERHFKLILLDKICQIFNLRRGNLCRALYHRWVFLVVVIVDECFHHKLVSIWILLSCAKTHYNCLVQLAVLNIARNERIKKQIVPNLIFEARLLLSTSILRINQLIKRIILGTKKIQV